MKRLLLLHLLAAACGLWALAAAEAGIAVYREGRALLPVVVSGEATAAEKAAATELARVLGVMSGLDWPVLRDAPDAAGFHLGGRTDQSTAPERAADPLTAMAHGRGPDSFTIRTQDDKVLISGATPEATQHAVAWLLQQHAGVRWYAPGKLGEVVPRLAKWTLPSLNQDVSPAYFSRELHGAGIGDGSPWAIRHGLRGRFEFGHALSRVFPPAVMVEHPEWQPLVRGRRLVPSDASDRHWQPNLAQPAVAAHAAEFAVAAFAQEPERLSLSLGINDTLRFDQSGDTAAVITPLRWFRGMPDYSALIFGFMNRAAAGLSLSRTDRYLGGLAYLWCENAPPFAVHPQVLPYVTADRSQYYSSSYREDDLALMSRWQQSGVRTFGLWEYAYGGGFLIPRNTTRMQAEALQEGWKRGARGYFAEVEPHPGFDAFKTWALARLLWDPTQSVDDLAADFFTGYYGAAAVPMRTFFFRCEEIWQQQPGPPYWLKFYRQEDQALLFPPEICEELRALLITASRLTDDPLVQARIELTARALAVTESYVRFDRLRRGLAAWAEVAPGRSAEQELAERLRAMVRSRGDFLARLEQAEGGAHPAMGKTDPAPFLVNDPVPRLLWQIGRHDAAAPGRVLAQAGEAGSPVSSWKALVEVFAGGTADHGTELLTNGSFSEVADDVPEPRFLYPKFGPMPADWEWRSVATEQGVIRVIGSANAKVVRVEGAWDTQVYQWRRAQPTAVYVARARLRGQSSPGGDASLYFTFLTADGRVTGTHHLQSLPKEATDDWREMVIADRAPPDAAWVGIGFGSSRQNEGDWLEARDASLKEYSAGGGT